VWWGFLRIFSISSERKMVELAGSEDPKPMIQEGKLR
jgi:hypothetical protein